MGKCIIIAEAGVNHNGDFTRAKEMVVAAKNAGADYVKFQAVSDTSNLISRGASMADYQKRNTGSEQSQLEMVRRLMLPLEQYRDLSELCRSEGIGFVATPFDIASVEYLASLGMDFMKVPSGEITDKPYLEAIAAAGMKVVMSTGMSTLGDIEQALTVLYKGGITEDMITLLHCNTEYPTPFSDVNLRAMATLRQAFGTSVGYSDHTLGTDVPVAAVALGASVIEKHFTMSRDLEGPDNAASLVPEELDRMVRSIRNVELALGSPVKRVSGSEQRNLAVARRSIVAARKIEAGQIMTRDDLTAKRPGNGISPMLIDDVVGRRAIRDFNIDDLIEL